jgi:hypothetical protein
VPVIPFALGDVLTCPRVSGSNLFQQKEEGGILLIVEDRQEEEEKDKSTWIETDHARFYLPSSSVSAGAKEDLTVGVCVHVL